MINMTPEQFCYWLQGKMEIDDPKLLSEKEVRIIKEHLQLVFTKETPDFTLPSLKLEDPISWKLGDRNSNSNDLGDLLC